MIQFLDAAELLVPFTVHQFEFTPGREPVGSDYPFVVLWADGGWEFSGDLAGWDSSLSDDPNHLELNIRATYTGLTKESANVLLTRTRAVLNRAKLSVPGWSCSRLKQAPLQGIQADKSVQIGGRHPHYAVDEFRLIATKEQ